jgi:phosphopantothenoylcysteine decarboxylase/phosphopantothenate--cysteine ligase
VKIVSHNGIEQWPDMAKDEVASKLAALIADRFRQG